MAASVHGIPTTPFLMGLALACVVPAQAGEVEQIEISAQDGQFFCHIEADIEASPAQVQRLLTDFDNLNRLNDNIVSSRQLPHSDNSLPRVKVVTNVCVLFFCRELTRVEDVEILDSGSIVATIVPEHSDFLSGQTLWRLDPIDETRTHLNYYTVLQPAFWVPAVLGEWAFKNRLQQGSREIIDRIEELSRQDTRRSSGNGNPAAR